MIAALAADVALPTLGLLATGRDMKPYMEFPPLTRYVEHAPFSWPVFIGLAVFILVFIVPLDFWVWWNRVAGVRSETSVKDERRAFPWWGWMGAVLGVASWLLAWSRFSWFAKIQPFTFSPLWFGYIIVVNAMTYRRTGHCMLRDRPVTMFKLFLLSAIFWWYFEYLNRFVQNWYYVGVRDISKWEYFIFATLPFSTVLPAVLGTYELLDSYGRAGAGLDSFMQVRMGNAGKRIAAGALVLSGLGLALIGLLPDYLFPLLWISPLVRVVSVQSLTGRKTILSPTIDGKWRKIYLLAAAALICGMFWEMWNFYSQAKWIYAVPFVGSFKLFEMPVLGYAGYLPFGLECAVIAELVGYKDCSECRSEHRE